MSKRARGRSCSPCGPSEKGLLWYFIFLACVSLSVFIRSGTFLCTYSFLFLICLLRLFACVQGLKCPVCSKFILPDDIECHLVMCLTKPRLSYNGKSDNCDKRCYIYLLCRETIDNFEQVKPETKNKLEQ